MEKLNYDELDEKVKEFYNNGPACQVTIINDEDKHKRLSQLI